MKKQAGYTLPELMIIVWFLIIVVGGIGWIWNIVKIVHTCCQVMDGLMVIRLIGIIVAPLGAVVGYF